MPKEMLFTVCAATVAATATLRAANPILPLWEFVPDGEPYVFEDPDKPGSLRVYLYGSHDTRRLSYCGRDQPVWSASVEDLKRWRFDGIAFRSETDANGNALNANGLGDILFAPDAAVTTDADGKKTYWLYPNVRAKGRNSLVAKAARPAGPFTVANWKKDKPNETDGILDFDPAVLVDDDGRVYGYWGIWRSFAAELDPATMSTLKPGTKVVEDMVSGARQDGEFRFFEASSIRKIKDKYVLVYSRWTRKGESGLGDSNYTLAYAYAEKPLGPWKYGGTVIDARSPGIGPDGKVWPTATPNGNTHGGICEIGGRWYVFYHRQIGVSVYTRQAMVAPIAVEVEEGPGGKVTITGGEVTSEGFETGGLDPFAYHPAGIACHYTGKRPAEQKIVNGMRTFTFSGAYPEPFYCEAYEEKDPYGAKVNRCPIVHCTDGSVVGWKYFNFDRTHGAKNLHLAVDLEPQGVDGKVDIYAGRSTDGTFPPHGKGFEKVGSFEITSALSDGIGTVVADVDALSRLKGKNALYFVFSTSTPERSICRIEGFRFIARESEVGGVAMTPPPSFGATADGQDGRACRSGVYELKASAPAPEA